MLTAIQASELQPAIFVAAQFRNEIVYIWSGTGTISWNSHTWQGVGALGSISTIDEGSTVEAKGIALGLSGIDPQLLPDVLTQLQLGLPVTAYLGLFNGGSLIANPVTSWSGRMDQPTIDISGTEARISINCESRLLDMNTAARRRYTIEDQQRDYPGDLGFSFVDSIQEITLYWGQAPTTAANV